MTARPERCPGGENSGGGTGSDRDGAAGRLFRRQRDLPLPRPSFAVLLFARVEPLGIAWLRVASAGAAFALWRRPWHALRGRLVVALGVVLAVMNACFYLAIDRLPLGTVADRVPAASSSPRSASGHSQLPRAPPRRRRGVYALVDVRLEGEPAGVAFAFANAVLFAAYIVLAHRVARTSAIDGLAAAMLVATVAVTPIGLASAAPAFLDPVAIAAGIGVGLRRR